MDNKNVFASNLTYYMQLNKKSRRDVCRDLGFNYYTFTDWVKGRKYPRMDKVEKLASYFGILKSDLIEDRGLSSEPSDVEFSDELGFTNERARRWLEITDGVSLSDAEFDKMLDYLKFIVSQRGQ